MRKYKENEANKEMFFAEEREAKIKAQKEENERRKKQNALEAGTAAAGGGVPALEDTVAVPVHPTEKGVLRDSS
jgi:hypothetical protein